MPANDREVLRYLTASEDTAEAEDLLTFAMFAYERDEWIKHYAELHGNEPNQAEIDSWTANISDYHFASLRQKAITFFDTAARDYLRDEMSLARQQAIEEEIVTRVRAASAWWRQFAIAVITAVLTPIILGAILASILAYNKGFHVLGRETQNLQSGGTEPTQ